MLCDLSSGGVGSLHVRKVLRRPSETLQILDVDHRGHTTAPAGQEDRLMSGAGVVDDLIEAVARNRDRQVGHGTQYG